MTSFAMARQWLDGASTKIKAAGKAAISQARTRLGAAPLRALWQESAISLALEGQPGAFYRGLRLVSIAGSTLDVPDTAENLAHFGRQQSSRGQAAFPQLRFVALCENGHHAIFAVRIGPYATHELTLAAELVEDLREGMLCLADRLYPSFSLWKKSLSTGASLLWRTRSSADLPVEEVLADGSFLSRIFPLPDLSHRERQAQEAQWARRAGHRISTRRRRGG